MYFLCHKQKFLIFFYKCEFTGYSLTACCSINKKSNSSLWHECTAGRTADHLTGALINILKHIMVENLELEKIILLSDSYVSKNKNSVMSLAMLDFLRSNKTWS